MVMSHDARVQDGCKKNQVRQFVRVSNLATHGSKTRLQINYWPCHCHCPVSSQQIHSVTLSRLAQHTWLVSAWLAQGVTFQHISADTARQLKIACDSSPSPICAQVCQRWYEEASTLIPGHFPYCDQRASHSATFFHKASTVLVQLQTHVAKFSQLFNMYLYANCLNPNIGGVSPKDQNSNGIVQPTWPTIGPFRISSTQTHDQNLIWSQQLQSQ